MRFLIIISILCLLACVEKDSIEPPDWQVDPGAYQFPATIAGGVVIGDGDTTMAASGDLVGAFDDAGNARGIAVQLIPHFGPYQGQIVYEMQLFSNEGGVGSASIAHSAAKTDEPVREGIVAMIGPFIDTIVVCFMTASVILIT